MPIITPRVARFLLIATCALVAATAIVAMFLCREPRFDGKSLTYWLEELTYYARTTSDEALAVKALQTMGTNAVPHLTKLFHAKDSSIKEKWNAFMDKTGFSLFKLETAWNKRRKAMRGFYALREASGPVLVEIEQTLTNSSPDDLMFYQAVQDLMNLGPPGIPVLLRQTNQGVGSAIDPIIYIYTAESVQELMKAMKSDNVRERHRAVIYSDCAFEVFFAMCTNAPTRDRDGTLQLVVPLIFALTNASADSDAGVRKESRSILEGFRSRAKSAISGGTNAVAPQYVGTITNALLVVENFEKQTGSLSIKKER